jgi:LPS-assembly lipoprotein
MDTNINIIFNTMFKQRVGTSFLFLIFILSFLSSCGFRPIYYSEQSKREGLDYHNELILVKIKKYRTDIDYELHKHLTKILNPYNLVTKKKYLLDIKLTNKMLSTFTTSAGSSGRNKVLLIANYKLTDIVSGELIGYGDSDENSDFDVSQKRFANYTTEEQTKRNLTKLIARDIRNMIINDLYKLLTSK